MSAINVNTGGFSINSSLMGSDSGGESDSTVNSTTRKNCKRKKVQESSESSGTDTTIESDNKDFKALLEQKDATIKQI